MKEKIDARAKTLMEALPYIQKYSGKIVVIKYGGNAMISNEKKYSVLRDVVLLKLVGINPVIVHGGGPDISIAMKKARIKPEFVNGLRVTDKKTITIVEKELEKINRQLVAMIKKLGGKAIQMSGKDNRLIVVKKKDNKLGYVGDITRVNTNVIKSLIKDSYIPVISPIGVGPKNETYNINADSAAASIAAALKAEKLTMMTDVEGIMIKGKFVSSVDVSKLDNMIKKGVLHGGMVPKVKACRYAVKKGVKKAHLINGTTPHAILLEIFTDKGVGTEIK